MKTLLTLGLSLVGFAAIAPQANAHCQVPCGIYSDDTVFTDLKTHIATIEKAMAEINKLSKDANKNVNQLVRWVNNKEEHAQAIQDVVAKYFLAQRVKVNEKDKNKYLQKLTLLHEMTVYAMKCKQTTDKENVHKLQHALAAFHKLYKAK